MAISHNESMLRHSNHSSSVINVYRLYKYLALNTFSNTLIRGCIKIKLDAPQIIYPINSQPMYGTKTSGTFTRPSGC